MMASEYWQLDCSGLKERATHLFRTKLWADVSFQFNGENQEGTTFIKAHRLILAMASPVFAKLFYEDIWPHNDPIPVLKITASTFEILLEYIYSDNLNIDSINTACNMYKAAKKLRMPFVVQECLAFLSRNLNGSNVCQIYEMALSSDHILMRACEKIFQLKTQEVFKHDSFLQAQRDTVSKIFSLPSLNIDSEWDLFCAAVRYADAQDWLCHQNQGPREKNCRDDELEPITDSKISDDLERDIYENDSTVSFEIVKRSKEEKSEYRDLVEKIRFMTVSAIEFAECDLLPALLTREQITALCMNICSKLTHSPMPEGFSTSLVPRSLCNVYERSKPWGTYLVCIYNVRNLKKYDSATFYVRNMAWTLQIDATSDHVVIGVTCYFENQVPSWFPEVRVRLKFISHQHRPVQMKLNLTGTWKTKPGNSFTSHRIWLTQVRKSHLLDPDHGFVNGDAISCKVYITTEASSDTTSTNDVDYVEEIPGTVSTHVSVDRLIPIDSLKEQFLRDTESEPNRLPRLTSTSNPKGNTLWKHSLDDSQEESIPTTSNIKNLFKKRKLSSPIFGETQSYKKIAIIPRQETLDSTFDNKDDVKIELHNDSNVGDNDLFSDDYLDDTSKKTNGYDNEENYKATDKETSNNQTNMEDSVKYIFSQSINAKSTGNSFDENLSDLENNSINDYYHKKIDNYIKQNLLIDTNASEDNLDEKVEIVSNNIIESTVELKENKDVHSTSKNPLCLKTISLVKIMKLLNIQ